MPDGRNEKLSAADLGPIKYGTRLVWSMPSVSLNNITACYNNKNIEFFFKNVTFGAVGSNSDHRFRFRFQTVHLLYLTTVIAAAIAMFDAFAVIWIACVLLFWFCWTDSVLVFCKKRWPTAVESLIIVIVLALIVAAMLPRVQSVREAAKRTACSNQMRQLSLAMLNYESSFMNFPPAYMADEEGKALHSWRILLLPYIEESDVYSKYSFDEPWNGPNNRKLVDQIAPDGPFFCPGNLNHGFKTPYKLVTGKGTAFEADSKTILGQFANSCSETISIIEDNANSVCWMQPNDLTVEEAIKLFAFESMPKSYHVYKSKFIVRRQFFKTIAFFDGSVRAAGFHNKPEQLRQFFMIGGTRDQRFGDLQFVFPEIKDTVLYSGYFLLGFNCLLAVLPVVWKRLQLFQPDDNL